MESDTPSKQREKDYTEIDSSTEKNLNKFNPISGIESSKNGQRRISVQVTGIDCPDAVSILRRRNPTITVNLYNEEMGVEFSLDLLMDKFSENTNDTTLTSFLASLGIEREDMKYVVGEKIEVSVSKKTTGYKLNPVPIRDFRPSETTDIDLTNIENLWKAQKYGKAKIISVDSRRIAKEATIELEIPWCDAKQSITLSTSPKDEYTFTAFFKSVAGHPPVSRDEVSEIVGEEIRVNYEGKFGLARSLEKRIKDRNYSFTEYVQHNLDGVKSRFIRNMLISGLALMMPPFLFVTIVILAPLFSSSASLGILGMGVLTILSSLFMTGIDATNSYRSAKPLS